MIEDKLGGNNESTDKTKSNVLQFNSIIQSRWPWINWSWNKAICFLYSTRLS